MNTKHDGKQGGKEKTRRKALCCAKEVEITMPDNRKIIGRLEEVTYKGKKIITYRIGIPYMTEGHAWTKEEREKLYQGKAVPLQEEDQGEPGHGNRKALWDEKERKVIFIAESEE